MIVINFRKKLKTTEIMTAKQKAVDIFNTNYVILFEYGEELSEEMVISLLSIKFGVKQCDDIIKLLNENYEGYSTDDVYFYEKVKQSLLEM